LRRNAVCRGRSAVVRIGHYSLLLPFLKRWLPTRSLDRLLSWLLSWTGFIQREPDPKGDRVRILLSGKFLPYKTY